MLNGWFFAALVPVLIEALLTWARPEWLAVLPSWRVTERTIQLRNAKRLASEGYRDAGALVPLPTFAARTELTGAVMLAREGRGGDRAREGRVVVRRVFDAGRRAIWVVFVDITRTSESVTLRARQVVTPITMLVSAPLCVCAVMHHVSFVWMMLGTALAFTSYATHMLVGRAARDAALGEAFRNLEEQLRDGLEER